MIKKNGLSVVMPIDSERLADAYSKFIPRFRQAGGDASIDIEDITQDACVRILQLKRPDAVEDTPSYLSRVVQNLFIDRRRSRTREGTLFDRSVDPELSADSISPERVLIGKQRLQIALLTIDRLPLRCREAFRLRRVEGLSYAAIANQMGISVSTVEKYMANALLKLAQALAGYEDTSN